MSFFVIISLSGRGLWGCLIFLSLFVLPFLVIHLSPQMNIPMNWASKLIDVVIIRHAMSKMKLKTEMMFCMSLMKNDIQPPPYCFARLSMLSNHQTAIIINRKPEAINPVGPKIIVHV